MLDAFGLATVKSGAIGRVSRGRNDSEQKAASLALDSPPKKQHATGSRKRSPSKRSRRK